MSNSSQQHVQILQYHYPNMKHQINTAAPAQIVPSVDQAMFMSEP